MSARFGVLGEPGYRRFIAGYGLSYIFYWITLLSIGWWMWETTHSAAWVGLAYFCDLAPALFVTPWAAALADRGDRFRILKTVLWVQVATGFSLAVVAAVGLLTPAILAAFALVEGTLVGFSQPAFFGLLNRLVSPRNLSAAVGMNVSIVQASYVIGPLLAGSIFGFGLGVAPLAFAANATGTLLYLWCLAGVPLRDAAATPASSTSLGADMRAGLTVFWANPIVFKALVLALVAAALQRPLISLMPAINDRFALFSAPHFTVLTASFMCGGVVAGLIHARRNSTTGQDHGLALVLIAVVAAFGLLFPVLQHTSHPALVAVAALFLLGLGGGYVVTGTSVILQNRTEDAMRSRVLGNALMLTRAMGAFSVLVLGIAVDRVGFTTAMMSLAALAALLAPLSLALHRRRSGGQAAPDPS